MHRQATIKLLARSLVVLFLAFLTTAPSCDEIIKDFFDLSSSRTIKELSESSPEEQRTAAAALLTLEATARESSRSMTVEAQATVLALLPPSPSSGQVTTIPLPTHTATPTPTSPNTPTPASTPTRTPTPTSTPTLATKIYQDLPGDCGEYTAGKSVPCPKGYDIRQVEISVINNVLTLRVVFSDIFTGVLAIRYTTPPGVGAQVQGVATYQGIENGNWLAWKVYQDGCRPEDGPVNPPNNSCQVTDKETKITVPVPELGQVSVPLDFRVFTIDFADQNPNTPVDLAPNLPDTHQITLQRPDSPFHPIFNPWQIVAK